RLAALDEAGVDDVGRMHVAAALELRLLLREAELGGDLFHRATRACGRQPDIVVVDERGSTLEALVAGVADEPEPRVHPAGDIVEGATKLADETRRHDRPAVLDRERRDRSPGRI